MKTKPSKFVEVLRLILVYNYVASRDSGEVTMNQDSFASFLKLSRRTVIRHFELAKEMKFLEVTGRRHIYSHKKRSQWPAVFYKVNQNKINSFIEKETEYNILDNIQNEVGTYYDFLTFCRNASKQKYLDSLTEEEKVEYIESEVQKEKERQNELDRLKVKNKYFLDLLDEVNNDILPMHYLNDGKKRLINVLCTTRNSSHDATRLTLLRKYFNTEEKIVEFDTNASIYRLSYALGNKECASFDVDIYKLIFDKCKFNIRWSGEIRKKFKTLLMPIYMRENSIKFRCLNYEKRKYWTWFANKKDKEECEFYKYLEEQIGMPIYDILMTVKKSMHEIFNLNKFYRANIFIYESNLHILMFKIFKDLGIKTINVYDGFYFVEGTMTKELYNAVYKQATEELLSLIDSI